MAEALGDDGKDDLRNTLADALSGDIKPDTTPLPEVTAEPEVKVETAEQKADRARDEAGRFAKEKRDTLALKPKESKQPVAVAPPGSEGKAPPAATADPKGAVAAAPPEGAAPPIEWKGEAKVDWQRLPKGVQAAIRESYDALQTASAEVAPLREMIDANRQMLVNEAGSVQEGVRQLLAFHKASIDKPIDLCAHILRARGIDPATAFSGQPQQQQGTQNGQPDIGAIIAQAVQRELQPLKAQYEQRESQTFVSQIDAFAADPANPYFNDVKAHMGALLKAGIATNLQDAYDRATWMNPVIRSQLEARKAEDAANIKAAEVQKAQQAQRASLTGSPTLGATAQASSGSDDSIRGALTQAWNARQGAV